MTLSNISSKARIWSGVFTELNSGFSDLQSGMQNSFRCLVAVNLCLAKRVNRDISAKYDLPPTTCHLPLPPATCHCHLPPTTCYHFSSLKKRAWQNIKLQHLSHLPPATTHLPPATCHLPPLQKHVHGAVSLLSSIVAFLICNGHVMKSMNSS